MTKKKFTGKISTLFHFLRNTPVARNLETGKTATFQIDNKPILSITQKAGNFDESVFTVTKMEIEEDEDTEQSEESEISSEDMKIHLESENFENDSNNGFDEID